MAKKNILAAIAVALTIAIMSIGSVSATDKVDLFFLVDGSGSISSSDFQLQKEGLAEAIKDSTVIPQDGSVSVCVIVFGYGDDAKVIVSPTTINSQSTADSVFATVMAQSQPGGGTPMAAAFDLAVANFPGDPSGRQVIDLSTDGEPDSATATTNSRDAALDKGFDEVNAIGVGLTPGGSAEQFLQNLASPQPSTSAPGFYMPAVSYQEFKDKMRDKIIKEVQPTPTQPSEGPSGGQAAAAAIAIAAIMIFIYILKKQPRREPVKEKKKPEPDEEEKQQYGSIFASSDPDGAVVLLDGAYQGISAMNIDDILIGPHIVVFAKFGYFACKREVVVNADQQTLVHCDLTEIPELKLKLAAEPSKINADGKSESKIKIWIEDNNENKVPVPEDVTVELETNKGKIESPVKILAGHASVTATLTSPTDKGTATVKAKAEFLKGSTTAEFAGVKKEEVKKKIRNKKIELSSKEITGIIIAVAGLLLLLYTYITANHFVSGGLMIDERLGIRIIFLICMIGIGGYLTEKGATLTENPRIIGIILTPIGLFMLCFSFIIANRFVNGEFMFDESFLIFFIEIIFFICMIGIGGYLTGKGVTLTAYPKITGFILTPIGAFMLLFSFITATGFVSGDFMADETFIIRIIYFICMIGIGGYLTGRGASEISKK